MDETRSSWSYAFDPYDYHYHWAVGARAAAAWRPPCNNGDGKGFTKGFNVPGGSNVPVPWGLVEGGSGKGTPASTMRPVARSIWGKGGKGLVCEGDMMCETFVGDTTWQGICRNIAGIQACASSLAAAMEEPHGPTMRAQPSSSNAARRPRSRSRSYSRFLAWRAARRAARSPAAREEASRSVPAGEGQEEHARAAWAPPVELTNRDLHSGSATDMWTNDFPAPSSLDNGLGRWDIGQDTMRASSMHGVPVAVQTRCPGREV